MKDMEGGEESAGADPEGGAEKSTGGDEESKKGGAGAGGDTGGSGRISVGTEKFVCIRDIFIGSSVRKPHRTFDISEWTPG